VPKRTFALLALATAFALVPGGQAKRPLDGLDICGSTGCVHLTTDEGLSVPISFNRQNEVRAPAPSSFYLVRWHWPGGPNNSAYYAPARKAMRIVVEDGVVWMEVEPEGVRTLSQAVSTLEPFEPPVVTRVTVGRRVAHRPTTYLRLFGAGREVVWPSGAHGWLRIRFESVAPSPWTDPAVRIYLSRRGSFLRVNDYPYFRLPPWVATRARRGLSLTR